MEEEKKEESVVEETKKENILTRKKEVKGKPLKIWLIVMIVIFMLFTFGLGLYLGTEVFTKKQDKKPTESNPAEEKKEEKDEKEKKEETIEIDVNSKVVEDAFKSFTSLGITGDALYKTGLYTIENITQLEFISTMLQQVPFENVGHCGSFVYSVGDVSLDLLNNGLSKVIYNKSVTLDELKSLAKEYNEYTETYNYYGNNDRFYGIKGDKIYIGSNVCEGSGFKDVVFKKYEKAEKVEDTLFIYEKRAFYNIDYVTKKVNYYSDFDKTQLVESKNAKIGEDPLGNGAPVEQKEEISWDSYNTYKYSFKLIDGTYYFQSVELVK